MEYSRTTGFCVASITLVAAEANADDEVSAEGDIDAAVRAEVSDTEKALLAVIAAAAVADGDEFGGIFFLRQVLDHSRKLRSALDPK